MTTVTTENVWADEARRLLGDQIGEPIEDALPLSHTGFATRKALSVGMRGFGILPSLLARAASKRHSKAKAGGLPERFLLVLTPTRAVAYGYHGMPGRKFRLDEEPAGAWQRATLRVAAEPGRLFTNVTLIDGEQRYACQIGSSPVTDAFLAKLGV